MQSSTREQSSAEAKSEPLTYGLQVSKSLRACQNLSRPILVAPAPSEQERAVKLRPCHPGPCNSKYSGTQVRQCGGETALRNRVRSVSNPALPHPTLTPTTETGETRHSPRLTGMPALTLTHTHFSQNANVRGKDKNPRADK